VKSDVTDLLSTINFQLSTQCIALTGRSNFGKRTRRDAAGYLYCPFRAIKSKMTRKDDDKTKIPLIYYKKRLIRSVLLKIRVIFQLNFQKKKKRIIIVSTNFIFNLVFLTKQP
jgi:hypothetical protein